MNDQCRTCTIREHLKRCESEECDIHDSWYAEQLQSQVARLRKQNAKLKARVADLQERVDDLLREARIKS